MPSDCIVIAAMNPCPCGHLGDPDRECTCPAQRLAAYRSRVSGPLLDRFDLRVQAPRAESHGAPGEESAAVAGRVAEAARRLAGAELELHPRAARLMDERSTFACSPAAAPRACWPSRERSPRWPAPGRSKATTLPRRCPTGSPCEGLRCAGGRGSCRVRGRGDAGRPPRRRLHRRSRRLAAGAGRTRCTGGARRRGRPGTPARRPRLPCAAGRAGDPGGWTRRPRLSGGARDAARPAAGRVHPRPPGSAGPVRRAGGDRRRPPGRRRRSSARPRAGAVLRNRASGLWSAVLRWESTRRPMPGAWTAAVRRSRCSAAAST